MPLYLLSSQIPELKHLPGLEREELVEEAIFGVPITLRTLLTFAGTVLPVVALAGRLSLVLGRWVAYAFLPVGGCIMWVALLNLAQGRIRELVRVRNEIRRMREAS